jgi:hypothetical protein
MNYIALKLAFPPGLCSLLFEESEEKVEKPHPGDHRQYRFLSHESSMVPPPGPVLWVSAGSSLQPGVSVVPLSSLWVSARSHVHCADALPALHFKESQMFL